MKKYLEQPDVDALNNRAADEQLANRSYQYAANCMQKKQLRGFQAYFEAEATAELSHYQKLRDFANDMGEELDTPSTKEIAFKSDEIVNILNYFLKLESDLLEAYEEMWTEARRVAVKVFAQKMIKIQTESVGEVLDLLAEIESVGVGFVNQRLQA